MGVVTRFAPSPTGYLHIGGARTALFAWAYAKQQGGRFLLRIEDTDQARSDAAHSRAIIDAMDWLGLSPDGEVLFQSDFIAAHKAAVQRLLDEGRAYYCYAAPQELEALRAEQLARGDSPRYDRRWRDCQSPPPQGVDPVVRFKMPLDGETNFSDEVKGVLTVANSELDDFIILRADGTPTYNLAAVVDDISMGVTHIIRGDDHVMNTYRQSHLFAALSDKMPAFAHLPMILTAAIAEDGAVEKDNEGNVRYVRMSKRSATVDIGIYRKEGYLPQAMCNYLARLSWACGDAEVFNRDFFIKNFSFDAISQSPARFDVDKLNWLNREHIAQLPWHEVRDWAGIDQTVGEAAIELVRPRGDTLQAIKNEAAYFMFPPGPFPGEIDNAAAVQALSAGLQALAAWEAASVKQCIRDTAVAHRLGFKDLGMPLRAALTGRQESPDIAKIAAILGKEETLLRLRRFATGSPSA